MSFDRTRNTWLDTFIIIVRLEG